MNTLSELIDSFTDNESFLRGAEERVADRQIQLFVDSENFSEELNLPLSLQNPYTQVIETFNADWSDPDELRSPVMPYLSALCDHWETVRTSHDAAIRYLTRQASSASRTACTCEAFAMCPIQISPLGWVV